MSPTGRTPSSPARIEAQQMTPLQERDAPLEDEPPHVAYGHAEMLGDLLDIEQPRQRCTVGRDVSLKAHGRTKARMTRPTRANGPTVLEPRCCRTGRIPRRQVSLREHLHVCLLGPLVAEEVDAVIRTEAEARGGLARSGGVLGP
jgi:hypothetical protein